MANPYREIFKTKGTIAFSFFGLIARMPIAMLSISIIAMLNQFGYSYGDASYVAAAYILSSAFISPQMARLADLYGQNRIILSAGSVAAISLSILVYAATQKASLPMMMFWAVGGGFLPNFGAFVRTRWSNIYRKSKKLQTAFAFESIVDEIIFMIGPVIALGLTTAYAPQAGPLAAIAFLVFGSIAFLTQTKTQPPIHKHLQKERSSVLRMSEIRLLALVLLAIGAIYGACEITVFAFAKQLNQQTYTSIPLSAYALGSFITGIIYGITSWKLSLPRRFFIIIIFAALTTLPLLCVTNLWNLSAVLFLAGATCSPTIIITMTLIENIVPPNKLTEGMSWAGTSMATGTSVSAALSGHLIDQYGIMSGFYVGISAAILSLVFAFLGYNRLIKYNIVQE